jgi:hypothetical protein
MTASAAARPPAASGQLDFIPRGFGTDKFLCAVGSAGNRPDGAIRAEALRIDGFLPIG